MDPSIHSVYFARSNLKELSKQYWRYGYWKAQMLRRYPKTIRWRQALPPLFMFSLISLGLLSLLWCLARWMLAIIVLLYTIVIVVVGMKMSYRNKEISMSLGVPLAIATIHFSFGTAFLWGLVVNPRLKTPHK